MIELFLTALAALAGGTALGIKIGRWSVTLRHEHIWGNWERVENDPTRRPSQERECLGCGLVQRQPVDHGDYYTRSPGGFYYKV